MRSGCSSGSSPIVSGWSPTPKFCTKSFTAMWPSDRRDAIQPAFDALLGVVDEVFLVDRGAVERAKSIVLGHPRLSARDAVHLPVMQQHGVTRIMSFDAGFDSFPGVERLS
jgi:uncharacterized protein